VVVVSIVVIELAPLIVAPTTEGSVMAVVLIILVVVWSSYDIHIKWWGGN
jgi:hypothetical protein